MTTLDNYEAEFDVLFEETLLKAGSFDPQTQAKR